jgi:hypothetical protein
MAAKAVTQTDIALKWSKLTGPELVAIDSPETLAAQLVKSYNLDRAKAEAEVKSWLAGRVF